MHRTWICLLSLGLLIPLDAQAHNRHRRSGRVVVHVTPPPASRPAVVVGVSPGVGWVWVAGHPSRNAQWVQPHWTYKGSPPRPGWKYVEGYWRAGVWISGFWRPSVLAGFHWVDAHADASGNYLPGYWEPDGAAPDDMVWRPGYWDGARWISGQWVPAESYTLYGPDGELQFFGYGDGEVESVSVSPEPPPGEVALGAGDTPPEEEPVVQVVPPNLASPTTDVMDSPVEGTDVRHHGPPN